MTRVLIASTIVLTLALGVLLALKLRAQPAAPAATAPAATAPEVHAAEAHGAEPAKEPAKEGAKEGAPPKAETPKAEHPAGEAAEPPKPEAAAHAAPGKPEAEAHGAPAEPAKAEAEAHPKPAKPDAEAKAAEPKAKSKGKRRSERGEHTSPDDAAAAAIFSDRPPTDGEGSRPRTPRIPTLRPPTAGVAPPPHVSYAAAAAASTSPPPRPPSGARVAPSHGGGAAPARAAPGATAPVALRGAVPGPALVGAVTGTLRDAAGGLVAGASILAMAAAGDDALETVTDDEGFFLLAGMKPGRYLLFTGLMARRGPTLPARAVEVRDGQVARLDLREASGGATVRVRPLRPDGRPAAGQVLLVAGQAPPAASLATLLASDAIYLPDPSDPGLLRRVPPGVYTPVVLQGAATAPRVARQTVTVRSDGEQLLEVRLPAPTAEPQGAVR